MHKFKPSDALTIVLISAYAWLGQSSGYAQQTTERFIPIGQSPGISGKYSYIGEIVSIDADNHTIVVAGDRGRNAFKVTPQTRIWLDRSNAKRTNVPGSYDDCEVGRRVEVMHIRDDEAVADWIKIETG